MQKASFHSLKNKQSLPKAAHESVNNFSDSNLMTPKKSTSTAKKNMQSVQTCYSSTGANKSVANYSSSNRRRNHMTSNFSMSNTPDSLNMKKDESRPKWLSPKRERINKAITGYTN